MNIAKIFVFAALLVIATASMPWSSPSFAEQTFNAPQQGDPYGRTGEDRTAFNGKVQESNPCKDKTDSTFDATAFHNGPHADAQTYHKGSHAS